MNSIVTNRLVCLVMILAVLFPVTTFAGGYDNSSVGAKAYPMASAFTAIADDSSAVYHNPAGLSFLEGDTWYGQFYNNLYFAEITYETDIRDKSDEVYVIPGFFIAKRIGKWGFGYGSYIPYAGGGGAKYKNFQGSRYKTEGAAGFNAFTPAISYQFSPKLSVGAGFSMYWGVMESKAYQYMRVETEYDGVSGYGLHTGLLYKPADKWSLGLCIRSRVKMEMDGDVTADGKKSKSEVEYTLPYYISFGIGYKPDSKLTLSLDFCHMAWRDMDEMEFITWGETDDNITAGTKTIRKTWYDDSWRIGLGMEYQLKDNLALRGGLKYSGNATQRRGLDVSDDVNILVSPSSDIDMLVYSLGFAYDYSKKIEIDVTANHTYGLERDINNKKYNQEHIIFSFAGRFRF